MKKISALLIVLLGQRAYAGGGPASGSDDLMFLFTGVCMILALGFAGEKMLHGLRSRLKRKN